MNYYAGIGTRDIDHKKVFIMIEGIAKVLATKGWTLRSGGADGCDKVFETHCIEHAGLKEIYLPWRGFNKNPSSLYLDNLGNVADAEQIAEQHHPHWNYLTHAARKLHTRNVYQVLGRDLNTPVKFVVCYTKDGKASGGTGQAIRIAESLKIPVYNLFNYINNNEQNGCSSSEPESLIRILS